jgi:hypothetical protein
VLGTEERLAHEGNTKPLVAREVRRVGKMGVRIDEAGEGRRAG